MRQTLLVFLALMVATYLDYGQKRTYVRGQQDMVRAELQRAATGVVMEAMEVVYARAFDAATVGVPADSNVSVSDFAPGPFSGGADCAAFGGGTACDAVEDFHNMVPATREMPTPGGTLTFRVEVEVHYVDASMQRTGGSRTRWKEVTISVQDVQPGGGSVLSAPITFTEIHAYI